MRLLSPRFIPNHTLNPRYLQRSLVTSSRLLSQNKMSSNPYAHLPSPSSCYVDFCLVPIGGGSVSVAKEVAEIQKVLKASGLPFTLHSAGTTVEGGWDECMKVVGQCHTVIHQMGSVRIQTAMRVGSRTDKPQTADEKIKRVEGLLAEDAKSS